MLENIVSSLTHMQLICSCNNLKLNWLSIQMPGKYVKENKLGRSDGETRKPAS